MKKIITILLLVLLPLLSFSQKNKRIVTSSIRLYADIKLRNYILHIKKGDVFILSDVFTSSDALYKISQRIIYNDSYFYISQYQAVNNSKKVNKNEFNDYNTLVLNKNNISSLKNKYGNNYINYINYRDKIDSYKNLRSTGGVFIVIGGLTTGISAYIYFDGLNKLKDSNMLLNDSDEYFNNAKNTTISSYTMSIGGAILITGTILNIIGNNKIKKYKRKIEILNYMSFNPYLSNDNIGINIVYRF